MQAELVERAIRGDQATRSDSGQVLVAGGLSVIDGTARPQASAELYDPGSGN